MTSIDHHGPQTMSVAWGGRGVKWWGKRSRAEGRARKAKLRGSLHWRNADESTCPVSSVAGILVDLRADPQMTGSIQGDVGRFVRWHRGKWEFRSREVRTDLGLLSVIERFPTESN